MSSLHPVIDQIFDVIIDIAVPAGTCILYILKRKIYWFCFPCDGGVPRLIHTIKSKLGCTTTVCSFLTDCKCCTVNFGIFRNLTKIRIYFDISTAVLVCCTKSCKVSRLNTIIKSDIRIIVVTNLTGRTSLFHTDHVKGTLLNLYWCRIDPDRILTFFCRKPIPIWFYGQDCFSIFFPKFQCDQETDFPGSIFH